MTDNGTSSSTARGASSSARFTTAPPWRSFSKAPNNRTYFLGKIIPATALLGGIRIRHQETFLYVRIGPASAKFPRLHLPARAGYEVQPKKILRTFYQVGADFPRDKGNCSATFRRGIVDRKADHEIPANPKF